MPIALKLGTTGNLARFAVGDALLVDEIETLNPTGNLTVGSLLGATQSLYLGSAAATTVVRGNLSVIGSFTFSNYDLYLANDPVTVSTTYANTFVGNKLTNETWTRVSGGTLLKNIAYTYTGNKMTQEVRTIYASNGTTVVAQLTVAYSYTGNKMTSANSTRNV
jgi:hypothetical protein